MSLLSTLSLGLKILFLVVGGAHDALISTCIHGAGIAHGAMAIWQRYHDVM